MLAAFATDQERSTSAGVTTSQKVIATVMGIQLTWSGSVVGAAQATMTTMESVMIRRCLGVLIHLQTTTALRSLMTMDHASSHALVKSTPTSLTGMVTTV